MKKIGIIAAACLIAGCVTGTNGPVHISDNLYMIGGLGKFTEYSGSAVKARFFGEASAFCQGKGQKMVPVNSTAQDSQNGEDASAEVQFRCE